jgi:hypothetical protein
MSFDMNLNGLGYIGGALYSCGAGQIIGVPGTLISLIVAFVQKIASAIWSCKGTPEGKEVASKLNDKAKFSLKCAGSFALGIIPIVGGMAAFHFIWDGKF